MFKTIFSHWNKESLLKDLKKAADRLSLCTGGYSGTYSSAEEFREDLVDRITKYENGDEAVLEDLRVWFAPTCHWDDLVGDIELGERIYQKIKK
ncbi:MAG: hypothetical protein EOO46_24440 [Flavobacterium sp.]|nr:MAG: hypothetical protein EOO46_24440 [Flavobacterium sp.]